MRAIDQIVLWSQIEYKFQLQYGGTNSHALIFPVTLCQKIFPYNQHIFQTHMINIVRHIIYVKVLYYYTYMQLIAVNYPSVFAWATSNFLIGTAQERC